MTALEFIADFVSEIVKDNPESLELIFDELPSNPKSALYELFITDNTVLPWVLRSECPDVKRIDGYEYYAECPVDTLIDGYEYYEGYKSIYKISDKYIMETYRYNTFWSTWDFVTPETIMVPQTKWNEV